jgi:hypothetical protein
MRTVAIATLMAASIGVAACATYDRGRGDYGYDGRSYQRLGNDCGSFGGPGGKRLDPWLACTEEGEDIVRSRYARSGRLSGDEADEANVWFRRHADTNRDLRLTDPEIKAALVNAARHGGGRGR